MNPQVMKRLSQEVSPETLIALILDSLNRIETSTPESEKWYVQDQFSYIRGWLDELQNRLDK